MKVRIESDTDMRVIVDGKTTESVEIPARAPRYIEGAVLELRELGLVAAGVSQPEPSGD
jgi:hypothetical protein